MATLLEHSAHPAKEQLIGILAGFDSSWRTTELFLARLLVRPAFVTLAYAVAIAIQKASWLWVPVALLGSAGALASIMKCGLVELWTTTPIWKRWGWLMLIELGELAVVSCWGALWVRLVIVSGLYGIYQSVWVRLDWFGIFAALLSLVWGWFFSNEFNALFFFVLHYERRRQFRQETHAGA